MAWLLSGDDTGDYIPSTQSEVRERRENLKTLEHIRARHTKLSKKVMKARARYDERSRQLQALEGGMAGLLRRTYESGEPAAKPAPVAVSAWGAK